jgi:hypothetical protein
MKKTRVFIESGKNIIPLTDDYNPKVMIELLKNRSSKLVLRGNKKRGIKDIYW